MLSRIHPAWWFFGGSGLVLVTLGVMLFAPSLFSSKAKSTVPLVVWCAAGLRAPMEEIGKEYERQTGQPIELRCDASESILASIRTTQQGDVFVPADESYIDTARSNES